MQYDSFELLYVYIKKIDRCFENQSFNFSNDYYVEYDIKNKKLKITKNDNNVLKDFFSPKIKSINLVVGKNGSGKTTLFDLLGLTYDDRYKLFDLDNQDKVKGWFALYKCNNEAGFYVEGFNPDLLFDDYFCNNKEVHETYSLHIIYDFYKQCIVEKHFSGGHLHGDCPFIFYNGQRSLSSILPMSNINFRDDYSYLLNRQYIHKENLADLYYLATHNFSFFNDFTNDTLSIDIEIKNDVNYASDTEINDFFKYLVRNGQYLQLEKKERYIFNLYKTEILKIYYRVIKENREENRKYLEQLNKLKKDQYLIKIIRTLFQITSQFLDKINGGGRSFHYDSFLSEICNCISQLDNKYINYTYKENDDTPFIKSIEEILRIELPIIDSFDENVFNLLNVYETMKKRCELFGDFSRTFSVYFNTNISEGELGLINTYSGIYYALTNEYKNQKSAIILLDEPDKSFHPMWIASFIDNLIKLVESIDNEMTYQFIISTHSPFMLSDVPKEAITCIDIVNHHRIVSQAKTSFASNYYDIIKDTFFLKDSVGAFAKRKINEIIEEINNLNSNTNQETITKLNNLINIIDDPYLKNTLSLQLNKKIAKFNQKTALALEKQQLEARIKEITLLLGDKDD